MKEADPMFRTNRPDPIFEEKLVPSFRKNLGRMTYRKVILFIYLIRLFGAFLIILFSVAVTAQYENDHLGPIYIFCDIIMLFSIFGVFYNSESLHKVRGLGLRPLRVYENGLWIPPTYLRTLSRNGGYIPKERIKKITVRRWKKFFIRMQEYDVYIWYDAPVEFTVHLTTGLRRRSGPRPPESIKQAVDIMHERWNVPVVHKGSGNGKRKRVVDRKRVELIDL